MSAGDEQSAAAPDEARDGGGAGEPQRKKAKKAMSWRGHDGWSYRRGTALIEWVYIAPDGTEFVDEAAALNYENSLQPSHASGMFAGDDSASVEPEAAQGHASTTVRPQRERAPPKQFLAGPASGKVTDPAAEPPAPAQAVPKKDAGVRRASGTKRRRSSSLGGGKKYTARDNERPKEIAARLGVPVSELLKLNVGALPGLFTTSKLMEGTVLRLPARASLLAGSRRGWILCSEDDQWYEGDVVAAEGAGDGSFSVAYDEAPEFHASIEHNVARERVVCDGDRLFVSWDGELCNGLDWRARVSLI